MDMIMIISRTPLRISFVGGGSDLPSYYKNSTGSVISMAINRYIFVSVNKSFSDTVRIAYSRVEECAQFVDVKHPLVKNTAKLLGLRTGLEITSTADIPSQGSGLGSSSSFTVGLLNALSTYQGIIRRKEELAELACAVELEMCKEPIGKQDQYASAIGGVNVFKFHSDKPVERIKLNLRSYEENKFLNSMLIFYTGNTRNASDILKDQNQNTKSGKINVSLSEMVQLVEPFSHALANGDTKTCGEILGCNWKLKKSLSSRITSEYIDEIYDEAIAAGAWGGKLLGAGAGGFMLFLAPPSRHSYIINRLHKLKQQIWNIDFSGSAIIYQK
jgi:D-glycero-alpha-D-manno-heptose-7-phosphate kinase